jgi:hypothetical protein
VSYCEAASACVRLAEYLEPAMRRMMRTGDVGDYCPRSFKANGRLTKEDQAEVDKAMRSAINRIKKGESLEKVSEEMNVNPKTFRARLRNRGLSVTKIRQI